MSDIDSLVFNIRQLDFAGGVCVLVDVDDVIGDSACRAGYSVSDFILDVNDCIGECIEIQRAGIFKRAGVSGAERIVNGYGIFIFRRLACRSVEINGAGVDNAVCKIALDIGVI